MTEFNPLERQRLKHEELCLLIPWYINGTLSTAENKRLQEHLDSCLSCRSEFYLQREISRIVAEEDTEAEVLNYNLAKLRHRISTDSGITELQDTMYHGRVAADDVSYKKKKLRHGFMAMAAVITAAAVGLGFFRQFNGNDNPGPSPDYRTLSSSGSGVVTGSSDLFIVFEIGLTEIEVSEAMRSYGLEPVSHLADQRLWRVRLPQNERKDDAVSAVLASLKNDEKILFVERAPGGE